MTNTDTATQEEGATMSMAAGSTSAESVRVASTGSGSMNSQSMSPAQAAWFAEIFERLVTNVEAVLLGKTHVIRLAFTALLSDGHLLLEDVPGTGKTSLARAMAESVQGESNRVQFTPDLLPGDITGVNIYDQRSAAFEFHRGPIFANIVLADEINRASPKTQSALLEVMEESRITIDGVAYPVGSPFMVIATQNPIEQAGTYRLPEAQLDRFLMRTSIGYPDHASTVRILEGADQKAHERVLPAVVPGATIVNMSALARSVHVDASINDYVSRLVDASRTATEVRLGVSVRGALALIRTAKTRAAADGRHYVVPDDIKALAEPVLAHRVVLEPEAEFDGVTAPSVIGQILLETPPPSERDPM
jgi:MoxR-like ATPase